MLRLRTRGFNLNDRHCSNLIAPARCRYQSSGRTPLVANASNIVDFPAKNLSVSDAIERSYTELISAVLEAMSLGSDINKTIITDTNLSLNERIAKLNLSNEMSSLLAASLQTIEESRQSSEKVLKKISDRPQPAQPDS